MPYFGLLTNGVNGVVSCPVKRNIDGICVLSSIFLFYHLPTAGNWSALQLHPQDVICMYISLSTGEMGTEVKNIGTKGLVLWELG